MGILAFLDSFAVITVTILRAQKDTARDSMMSCREWVNIEGAIIMLWLSFMSEPLVDSTKHVCWMLIWDVRCNASEKDKS
jgi:hypothetical protein